MPQHRNWQVSVSQVLTRNLLLGLNFETDESDGYLQSPYRGVRFVDPFSARGYSFGPAVAPSTRTGSAASAQLKYYLPWHAALEGNYRLYDDTWGMFANTVKFGYTQSLFTDWTFEAMHATTGRATPLSTATCTRTRIHRISPPATRELRSSTASPWPGRKLRVSPRLAALGQQGDAEFNYNRLHIDYQDFHDNLIPSLIPGDEPLYAYDASVMQFFISFGTERSFASWAQMPWRRIMTRSKFLLAILSTAALAAPLHSALAQTGEPSREEATLITATQVLEELAATPDQKVPDWLMQRAYGGRGGPEVIKGAFFFGGRYGNGVLTVRDAASGQFQQPGIRPPGCGSFGAQIGATSTDVVLVFVTPRSVENFARGKFTLGADVSVAAGPVVARPRRRPEKPPRSTRTRVPAVLFAGVALDGTVIAFDRSGNRSFYGG